VSEDARPARSVPSASSARERPPRRPPRWPRPRLCLPPSPRPPPRRARDSCSCEPRVLVFDPLTTMTAPSPARAPWTSSRATSRPDTWFAVFKIGYGLRLLAPFTDRRLAAAHGDRGGDGRRHRNGAARGLRPGAGSWSRRNPRRIPTGPTIPDLREVAAAVGGEELSLDRYVEGKPPSQGPSSASRRRWGVEGASRRLLRGGLALPGGHDAAVRRRVSTPTAPTSPSTPWTPAASPLTSRWA